MTVGRPKGCGAASDNDYDKDKLPRMPEGFAIEFDDDRLNELD